MAHTKNLGQPEQTIELEGIHEDAVEVGDFTVARVVAQPGWRWSLHMKSEVGTEWCEAHHVGWQLSGRQGYLMRDGITFEIGPDDVFDVPPGHDGYTVGDEPAVSIEWSGLRTWTGPIGTIADRVLVALLVTDLVNSTTTAIRLGDRAWRELLSAHYATIRTALDRYRGRDRHHGRRPAGDVRQPRSGHPLRGVDPRRCASRRPPCPRRRPCR